MILYRGMNGMVQSECRRLGAAGSKNLPTVPGSLSMGDTSNNERFTYFCNSHSLLSRGQTFLVLSHREMQWKWKACWSQKVRIGRLSDETGTYVADTPCCVTFFACCGDLISLTVDA